jgi:signal peptidase I
MSRRQWFVENVISLALALLLVFAIRSSVIEAFKIPSGSMIPTLMIGDHIFVNKFSYGVKVPFSDLFTDPINIVKRDPPKRGDIIVFIFPKDEQFYYIKRVIGVPGDTIQIKNKVLYVNGAEQKREPMPAARADALFTDLKEPTRYNASSTEAAIEHLDRGDGQTLDHMLFHDRNSYVNESFGPVTVPPESLFVMGDNRDFSNDSRFWGFVPFKNVKGRAMVVWLSIWINLDQGKFEFRPERIGTVLH